MRVWEKEDWIGQTIAPAEGSYWRAVEAQHLVATMRLVDTLDEQALLEQILEDSKPPVAAGHRALHYLLSTPFRYSTPQPSRFRPADAGGIWYGAGDLRTACAEVGYWRWRFLLDSAGLRDGELICEHTLFQARVKGRAIDLSGQPWARRRRDWSHPSNYSACHALADWARARSVQWIAYASVRHPGGQCAAVLDALALSLHEPARQQTWVGKVTRKQAMFSHGREGHAFAADHWL